MEITGKKENIQAKKGKLKCTSITKVAPNSQKAKTPLVDLTQASSFSLERDCSSNVGPFYVKLAQASPLAPKPEVT